MQEKFDQAVVAQAMEAGAHLWLLSKPIDAEVVKDGVNVKVEREGEIVDLKCNLLIGADGATLDKTILQDGSSKRDDDWISN